MSAEIEDRPDGTFKLTLPDGRSVESRSKAELAHIRACMEGPPDAVTRQFHQHCVGCGMCYRSRASCQDGHHRLFERRPHKPKRKPHADPPDQPVSGTIELRAYGVLRLTLSDGRTVESRAEGELCEILACQSRGRRAAGLPRHVHCRSCGICYRQHPTCEGGQHPERAEPTLEGMARAAKDPPPSGALGQRADGMWILKLSDGRGVESRDRAELLDVLACQQGTRENLLTHRHCRLCGMCFRGRQICDDGYHPLKERAARARVDHWPVCLNVQLSADEKRMYDETAEAQGLGRTPWLRLMVIQAAGASALRLPPLCPLPRHTEQGGLPVSHEQHSLIKQAARRQRLSISRWIRLVALTAVWYGL